MLEDSFGRRHDYLRISLTDKCNFRCNYCMPRGCGLTTSHHELMSPDEIAYISKVFVAMGVKRIRLTGGEPLIRKDFIKILDSLARLPVKLAITTNGMLLDQFLPLFKSVGLRSINISLDSLGPDKFHTITQRNEFVKVWNNLLLSIEAGFKVKLNVVVTQGVNDDEFIDFVTLTKDLPLHVRFIEFMPFFGNLWGTEKVVPSLEILKTVSDVYTICKLEDHPNSTSKAYRVDGYKGTFGVITTVTDSFCSSCNRLRLTSDGKLRNCLFAKDDTDLLTPLRKGKSINKLITSSVLKKDYKRSGLPDFTTFNDGDIKSLEHSMVKIGG